ncbi:MAG: phosphoribosylglycinamide formyltransferase [Candidatus Spyradocola sp.]|nr:phosphoribosylglycinamide formyltransferase [Candidatus Spyradocola sp.]
MVRAAVLVSGGGTNLQALLDAQDRGELGAANICYVVSNRKAAYALERARNHNVETGVLSKVMQPDPDKYDEQLLDMLRAHGADMIVLAGFLGILGPKVLEAYSGRIINIHPALIPSFCGKGFYGLHVHEAVLARGCKVTGATAHLVTAGVDEGPILLQKAVDVLPGDTPEILQRRVMEQAEWLLLPRAVKMLAEEIEQC